MEYYSTIKRNEVLIYVITWTMLENMLRERNQTQRTPYLWLHLYEISRIARKKVNSSCPAKEGGALGSTGFSFGGVLNILELDNGNGCIIL